MRSDTRRIVRQRLTPSATEPSRQEAGTEASALAVIATMIGRIITVRISVPVVRFAPLSCTTKITDCLRELLSRCSLIHGAIARIPISP